MPNSRALPKSTKSGQPKFLDNINAGIRRHKNSSINQNANNTSVSMGGATSLANRSSSHNQYDGYDKYETPQKNSAPASDNLLLLRQTGGDNAAADTGR